MTQGLSISEQAALLTYRSLCREAYAKEGAIALTALQKELDRGRDLQSQIRIQDLASGAAEGSAIALIELRRHKVALEDVISSGDFSDMHMYVVDFDGVPDVLTATVLNGEIDFDGQVLQDLAPEAGSSQWHSFSIIPTDNGGAAVFAWLGRSSVADQLISSLERIDDAQISNAIVRYAFEMADNTFVRPEWWEGLPPADRDALTRRMREGGVPIRAPDCLRDDGHRVADWRVRRRSRGLDFGSTEEDRP